MARGSLLLILALLLVTSLGAGGGSVHAVPSGNVSVEIVAVMPDPVAHNDPGEYVVIAVSGTISLAGWRLDDGETTPELPNETVSGRVVLTAEPDAVVTSIDARVLELDGRLALANSGETIRLKDGATVIDNVTYAQSREGELYQRTEDGWKWRPVGATAFPVARVDVTAARVFVFPDAASVPPAALARAQRRILLAGYTFRSARVVDTLCAAHERGVEVRVLVDASPVGGRNRPAAQQLDRLDACGVRVWVIGGEPARYAFHHPKYAVIDERALVLTENWKPSGTGGHANRGWGVLIGNPEVASKLAAVFKADLDYRGVESWRAVRRNQSFPAGNASTDDAYPERFEPERVSVEAVEVIVAPDNAERAVRSLLAAAIDSITIEQVSIGSRHQPFLVETLQAAERGVTVRILLSSAWYVREENQALVDWLNTYADKHDLPLQARVTEPRGQYKKLHAKGVIVDERAAVVGSLNWNNHSAR